MSTRQRTHILIVFLIFMASMASGETILYVDDDAPAGGDGTSWATAYKFLQDALSSAAAGAEANSIEIRVAQGVYKPISGRFELISGVALKGGYAGLGILDPNERDIKQYETIFSGDLLGNDVEVNDPRDLENEPTRLDNVGIFGIYKVDNVLLDGVTITGGHQFDPIDVRGLAGGGGMAIGESSPTIMNCTFRDNWANRDDGAVLIRSGHPTFYNCTFTENYARRGGG